MDTLKNTLFALASPPLVQDSLFPDFVCKGEELVVDYDDAQEATDFSASLNEDQLASFNRLEEFLDENSGEEFVDMYCLTASLYNDARWEKIRSLSNSLIESMGWEYERPESNGIEYDESDAF